MRAWGNIVLTNCSSSVRAARTWLVDRERLGFGTSVCFSILSEESGDSVIGSPVVTLRKSGGRASRRRPGQRRRVHRRGQLRPGRPARPRRRVVGTRPRHGLPDPGATAACGVVLAAGRARPQLDLAVRGRLAIGAGAPQRRAPPAALPGPATPADPGTGVEHQETPTSRGGDRLARAAPERGTQSATCTRRPGGRGTPYMGRSRVESLLGLDIDVVGVGRLHGQHPVQLGQRRG